MPLPRSSRCLAGRRPAEGTTGHIASGGGSVKSNGETAAARDLSGPERRPGETPGIHDAAKPWREALQRGRGRSLPGRADYRGAGNRGAPKPGSRPLSDNDTPQPPHGTASTKASRAISQHLLRHRPSRTARRRIAHYNSATAGRRATTPWRRARRPPRRWWDTSRGSRRSCRCRTTTRPPPARRRRGR